MKPDDLNEFRRSDGSLLVTAWRSVDMFDTEHGYRHGYRIEFDKSATPRERQLFDEYLDSCFEEAARAVADCVEQGIRGVGR